MSFDCAKLARYYNHGACEDKACQLIMGPNLDQEQLTTFESDLAVAQIARPHMYSFNASVHNMFHDSQQQSVGKQQNIPHPKTGWTSPWLFHKQRSAFSFRLLGICTHAS